MKNRIPFLFIVIFALPSQAEDRGPIIRLDQTSDKSLHVQRCPCQKPLGRVYPIFHHSRSRSIL